MTQGRLPLIIAAIFAALAGVVAYLAVQSERTEISRGWEPVPVVVAARDLSVGDELTRDNLTKGMLPSKRVTDSVVTVAANRRAPVYGQRLAVPMRAGDVLLFSHVHSRAAEQNLAANIIDKGRAISIRVSPESSVHHWIEPSDRVDVLGIFRDPQSREMVSVTLLQNVIVLATGRIGGRTNPKLLRESERAYSTVTLHVLPQAAEMLALAQELGTLYLTLRNPEDTEVLDLDETKTTMQTLLTGERAKRISRTQSKIFKVEIIRGKRSQTKAVR